MKGGWCKESKNSKDGNQRSLMLGIKESKVTNHRNLIQGIKLV